MQDEFKHPDPNSVSQHAAAFGAQAAVDPTMTPKKKKAPFAAGRVVITGANKGGGVQQGGAPGAGPEPASLHQLLSNVAVVQAQDGSDATSPLRAVERSRMRRLNKAEASSQPKGPLATSWSKKHKEHAKFHERVQKRPVDVENGRRRGRHAVARRVRRLLPVWGTVRSTVERQSRQ